MKQSIQIGTITLVLLAGIVLAGDNTKGIKSLQAKDWTVPGVKMEMKRIPAGSFTMGSPKDETGRREDEVQHEVKISKPFFMGVYEVTQRQFYKVMMPKDYDYEAWQYKRGPIADGTAFHYRADNNGRILFGTAAMGGELTLKKPMECVSWHRAREFCRKITETERKAGRLPNGYAYRLPTEAEWEYACRAGTEGPYNVEVDPNDLEEIKKFAFMSYCNGWASATSEVGKNRMPNAWGLYDMHGNVYEWCLDWYGEYAKGPVTDPLGPAKGTEKVVRGGCFALTSRLTERNYSAFLRSASRYSVPPDVRHYGIVGFRVVLAPEVELVD